MLANKREQTQSPSHIRLAARGHLVTIAGAGAYEGAACREVVVQFPDAGRKLCRARVGAAVPIPERRGPDIAARPDPV